MCQRGALAPPGRAGFTRYRRTMATRPSSRRLRRVEETSAGGLLIDGAGTDLAGRPVSLTGLRGLLIGRTGRGGELLWSLPKGHIEPGETAQQTAVREVAEETGVTGRVVDELGTVDFWFVASGQRVHKTVHHYLLVFEGGELSDEDIEVAEVAWVPLADIEQRLAYPDERALVAKVPHLLERSA